MLYHPPGESGDAMKATNRTISVSRRAAIGVVGFGVSTLLMPSSPAVASEAPLRDGQLANDLWEKAVEKAIAEGAEIHEGVVSGVQPVPYYHVSGVSNSLLLMIKGLPTQVEAVAAYNAYSNGNIDNCYDAWIQCSSGQSISNCVHSWTITDSGQTLCVSFTCSIKWPMNALEAACSFYCEFWEDGSGYLTGGPL